MKRIGIYTLGLMFVFLFSQCGPTINDAINYNNKIIREQSDVIDAINKLDIAVMTYDSNQIETTLKSTKLQVEKSIKNIEEIGGLGDDTQLLDACTEQFIMFESQINEEYAEQLSIYTARDAGNYTEEDAARSEELFKLIYNKYSPARDKFIKAQNEFAINWGFELKTKDL